MPIEIQRKKYWLSFCPVLHVYYQGSTEEEANENVIEALKLFMISCYERATLDDVLKEVGFSLEMETDSQPEHDDSLFVKVPIYLLAPDNQHIKWRV